MRHRFILLFTVLLTSTLLLFSACEHDNAQSEAEYGYVAFRLTKELSAETASRAGTLNWLSDAHKVTITMQSVDYGTTLKQTLPITYYDKELAEWGVT